MNGTAESGPIKMPVALMDLLAGHQLKEGILVELLRRERSGRGARVSVSLFQAAVASLANQAAGALMTGTVPGPIGSGHPNIVPYGTAYRSRDGRYVVLAIGTDDQFRRLARCLQKPALGDDPRFATNRDRIRHRDRLESKLSRAISQLEGEPLVDLLHELGVPAGLVRDVDEALQDPAARPLILGHPSGVAAVRTRAFGASDTFARELTPPPRLAQHTRSVLTGLLGYTADRVGSLDRDGIILQRRVEEVDD
jgi:crotonobetainyl-CoA:carnitine CoA-transferase CaiB-like acyl-CoA transferase